MAKLNRRFALVLAAACALPAQVAAYSGSDLEVALRKQEELRAGVKLSQDELYMVGYAKGFIRATGEALGARAICLPPDATAVQAEAIVLKYLRANPELWQKNAVDLVAVALMTTFPCAKP
jgi:ABC-type sugar transport system substrate-binding protein